MVLIWVQSLTFSMSEIGSPVCIKTHINPFNFKYLNQCDLLIKGYIQTPKNGVLEGYGRGHPYFETGARHELCGGQVVGHSLR